jgi:hypothetical protein
MPTIDLPTPETIGGPRNFWHDENPAYLGDFVRTTHGTNMTGRVYDVHYQCPESDFWLRGQKFLGDDPTVWKECRWVSILVHTGGAIVVPDQLVEVVEPFDLDNNNHGMYFRTESKED